MNVFWGQLLVPCKIEKYRFGRVIKGRGKGTPLAMNRGAGVATDGKEYGKKIFIYL